MKKHFTSYTDAFANLNREKIKLGLSAVEEVDAQLGYPSRHFSSVHVAGTNGKGSVSTKIAHALMYAGYKVGLYTSPHLLSFCERIWVGGQFISEECMCRYKEQVEEAAHRFGIHLTFFELLTLIAFLHFSYEKVEFAVIEVGMGGRLDATNIIKPRLSVITSIAYDHREHLGNTLEEIAFEKGGIIKPIVPVILGAQMDTLPFFQKIAKEKESPLFIAPEGKDFELQNKNTASLALDHVGVEISLEAKKKGLSIRPSCRFEIIRKSPPIILDVAHNEAGIEALFKKVHMHFPALFITVVAAFSCPYKAPLMGELIKSKAQRVYFTQANHERATPPPDLQGCTLELNVARALSLAEKEVTYDRGLLLVTGTFFMMPEVLDFFGAKEVKGFLYD